MKKASFTVKKWFVRMLVAVGGFLGFVSCQHSGGSTSSSQASDASASASVPGSSSATVQGTSSASISEVEPIPLVYGPRPDIVNGMEPVEIEPEPDVYGPPVITEPSEPVDIVPER